MSGIWCMVGGLAALAVGCFLARGLLRRARRLHRKHRGIHAAMPEGWGGWFFQGFSDLTMGTRWILAVGILGLWIVVGVALVSVGVCLVWHP